MFRTHRRLLLLVVAAASCGPAPVADDATSRPDTVVIAPPEPSPPSRAETGTEGGLRIVYGVEPPDATHPTATLLERRLSRLGLEGIGVRVAPPDEIVVEVRRAMDADAWREVRSLLERRGRLTIAACADAHDPIGDRVGDELPTGLIISEESAPFGAQGRVERHYAAVFARPGETEAATLERLTTWLHDNPSPSPHRLVVGPIDQGEHRGFRSYTLAADDALDGSAIADVTADDDRFTGQAILRVRFTDAGARAFAEVTQAHVQRRLAIVLDDRVLSAPVVMEAITGGEVLVNLAGASRGEAERLARLLQTGELPGRLEPRVEELIGPPSE